MKNHLKKIVVLKLLILWAPSFSFADSSQCLRLYELENRSVQMGKTVSIVSQILETNAGDIANSKSRLDQLLAAASTLNSSTIVGKINELNKDWQQASKTLSQEQIEFSTKALVKSKFLMGSLHEIFAAAVLKDMVLSELLKTFKSEDPNDRLIRKETASKILTTIQDQLRSSRWEAITYQEKIQWIEKMKLTYYEIKSISNKRMIAMMDSLHQVLNQPGGVELTEVLLDHTMYDITKIVDVKRAGTGTQLIGGVIKVGAYVAPAGIGIGYLLSLDLMSFTYLSTMAGGNWWIAFPIIGGLAGSGLGAYKMNKLRKEDEQNQLSNSPIPNLQTRIGSQVLALPKNASVQWRRWLQRAIARKKALSVFAQKQNQTIALSQTVTAKSPQPSKTLDTYFEQVGVDLQTALAQHPIKISSWGQGISESIMLVLNKNKELLDSQNNAANELIQLEKLGPDAKIRQQELNTELSQMLLELSTLSTDLLSISYALDLYIEKVNYELNADVLPKNFKGILSEKLKLFEINQQLLASVAVSIKSQIQANIETLQMGFGEIPLEQSNFIKTVESDLILP